MPVMDFFTDNFYWIDFTVSIIILTVVIILYSSKRIDRFTWYLYWIGCSLGLLWELPMSVANKFGIYPPACFLTPLPVHFSVIVITHCLWDGGLFLIGVWLVHLLCKSPHFTKFNIKELVIQLIWGQLQELMVELLSTFSDAWEFNVYWWNPLLFTFNNHNITLIPQLIWLIGPIVFYYITLKIKAKF
ncbi:MAG: hypothetical protein ACTSWY_10330 [Promethearchaeota archaeon]